MELEETPHHHHGGIYNYFQGATIHNLVINGNMNKNGNDYYQEEHCQEKHKYNDEQIAQAITAINGVKKPLNSKRKWAGVYWCLRWYCNFPPNAKDFCERVKELPLGELEFECAYNSIRHESTLSFMDQDARFMDKVKTSKMDEGFFKECRQVVLALATELGKAALPRLNL